MPNIMLLFQYLQLITDIAPLSCTHSHVIYKFWEGASICEDWPWIIQIF